MCRLLRYLFAQIRKYPAIQFGGIERYRNRRNITIEEVEKLLELDYSENSTALQGLGYKQIIAALKGKYSMNEAIQILKRDTRHYAKRQFTWFRKVENVHWIDLTERFFLEDVFLSVC